MSEGAFSIGVTILICNKSLCFSILLLTQLPTGPANIYIYMYACMYVCMYVWCFTWKSCILQFLMSMTDILSFVFCLFYLWELNSFSQLGYNYCIYVLAVFHMNCYLIFSTPQHLSSDSLKAFSVRCLEMVEKASSGRESVEGLKGEAETIYKEIVQHAGKWWSWEWVKEMGKGKRRKGEGGEERRGIRSGR